MTDNGGNTDEVEKVAEKIVEAVQKSIELDGGLNYTVKALKAYGDRRVEEERREIAAKQALIHGESVMLGGKVITNEELYKQPTDYIKEAKAEGFNEGVEAAARLVETHDELTRLHDGQMWAEPKHSDNRNGCGYAKTIRALKKGGVRGMSQITKEISKLLDENQALQEQNERLRELLLDSLWRMPDTKDNKEFKKTVKAALQEEKTDD